MIHIYGRIDCEYCVKAKELSDRHGILYRWHDVSNKETKETLLSLVPDAKTVPQIFNNSSLIGGYTEYSSYVQDVFYGE